MVKRLAGLLFAAVVALTAMEASAGYVVYTFEGHVDKGLLGGDPLGIHDQDFALQFWADDSTSPTSVNGNTGQFAALGLLNIGGVYSSIFEADIFLSEFIVPIINFNLLDGFEGLSTDNFTFPSNQYGGWAQIDAVLDPDAFDNVTDLPSHINPGDVNAILGQLLSAVAGNTFDKHYWLHTTDVSTISLTDAADLPAAQTPTPIPTPEPGTLALMTLGGLGLIGGGIRKRRTSSEAA